MNDAATNWHARATAWELASLSFAYPNADLVGALTSGEWADAAQELAEALDLPFSAEQAQEALPEEDADADELLHTLRAEATRLFVGSPDPVVSPYEGVWRAGDDGVQALLFVNPHSMDVERFVKSCGLGRAEGASNDPLDNVSTECALLEYLAGVEAGIMAMPEGRSANDLPGASAAAAYDTFMVDHVRVWIPRFAESTASETRAPFYRAAAAFLGALVQ